MPPTAQTSQVETVYTKVTNGSSKSANTTVETIEILGNGGANGHRDARKITILRDAVQRTTATYRSELGGSIDKFLNSCTTVDKFFDYVAGIRLRQIPHHSSRWDKVLKWAEFFAAQVYGYSQELAYFVADGDRAASIIWASCRSLLELGRENVDVLEKVFGVFYSCGLTLGLFLRQHELLHQTEELQLILANCYTDLLKLVTGVSLFYSRKQSNTKFSVRAFDELFSRNISSFFLHSDRFTDAIWAARLGSLAKHGDVSVDLVRDFLTPHDRVTRLLTMRRNVRKTRADFTCEWFDRHLADFMRGGKEIMIVSGKPRSGKTFLAGWTVERLQTLSGRRASEVVSHIIDPDLKTELTTMSVVKGLLLQMLQLNVGDSDLYKSLAHAYELSKKGGTTSQIENALWTALQAGLASGRNHSIVIDGIDQLKNGESDVTKLLGQLDSIVAKQSKTKVILFSRTLSSTVTQKHSHFVITPEQTRQDIWYLTESLLSSSPSHEVLSQEDRPTLIAKLAEVADGSFEWVVQAVDMLKTETTSAGTLKKLDTFPKTLDAIITQVISTVDLKQRDAKSLLAWILVSQRPLLLAEITQLFEIDTINSTRTPRTTRIEDDVVKALGPLIAIRGGFVRFANPIIKQILEHRARTVTDFKNTGAFPFHIQEAHYDLTVRSLAYIKMILVRPTQPTLSPLNDYELDELFNQYNLLQYAARYWSWHFEASPMHEPTVQHKITQGFKTVFPHTAMLPIIEGSCYPHQSSFQDAIDHHLLTLSTRRMVIGDHTEPVLQTLLNLAILKEVTLQHNEVNEYYYDAWKIASTLKSTSVATTCAHRYIERTSTIKITSKSTTAIQRSEVLEYIITIYKETRVSQTEVLIYLELLVTLYVTIGEIEKVTKLRREIYQLHVKIYGRSAPQTLRAHGELVTVVSRSNRTEEIQEITESNYQEASRTLPVTDPKRLDLTWSMIDIYTKRKDNRRVEELLVWLWQSWTHHSQNDTKSQQQRFDIALRYVAFLKTHDRKAEAENILCGIVTDLEQIETDDEETIKRSRTVGDELTVLGSVAAARGIFARVWAYYVRTGKTNTSEAKSVSTQLEETTNHSITETTTEITTVREIFDHVITKTTTKTIDTRTVHTSMTLVETYWNEQRWEEVVEVSTATLSRLWVGWTSSEMRTPLPSNYQNETITLIRRLFTSYWKLRRTEEAETTLRRLFYAVLSTPNSTDRLLLLTANDLIDFYETNGMVEKSVSIYNDLYPEIEKRKGKTDALTVKTLYAMGDTSIRVNDLKNAEFAYRKVHSNLGPEICHRDAIRAAQTLITVYEQQRQHSNAQKIYQSIWQMFIKHGKEYDLKSDWSENLYEKYVRSLKQDPKVEYNTLRHIAVDYRKALVRFYGLSHESTIKATLGLAEINEEKSEHRVEAITMYEEADKQTREAPKGQISESTIHNVDTNRKRLPYLYSISQLSTSPRAVPLYEQEWQTYHTKHGHAHGDSLKWLTLLVIALAKQNGLDSKTRATSTILTSVTDVLKKEKSSQKLWDSGSGLANVYLKADMKTEGEQLLQQLRSQVIFGDSSMAQSLGLTPSSNLDRRTWIFLVSLQTTLHGTRQLYTTIMADLINEVFLYDAYRSIVSQKAPVLDCLAYGSRLLQFMRDIHDEPSHIRVERELSEYFATNLSVPKNINASVLREFFEIVLSEVHHQDLDVAALKAGSTNAVSYFDKGKYAEAHDTALLVDRFQQFVGGYGSIEKINYGLQMALAVAGYKKTKVGDAKLKTAMLELAGKIAKELVQEARVGHVVLEDIPLKDLNTASGLLGELGNLDDLDYILTSLWKARTTQTSWPASTIVSMGRCLVETEFARTHHASAIHLCEDMCYNLRRVWGALDATTLDMHVLLSELYTSSEQYRKGMQVHEDVLRDTVSDKGEEINQAEAAATAVRHLELLRRAYQRLGGWDKEPQVYIDLYQQLAHVFGSEENWKKAKIQGVEKWSPKGADAVGAWARPESFEWMESEGQRKHANYLRRSLRSGVEWKAAHFHGGRLTRSYSSRSAVAK
ncbi:uncharacterized protein PAC_19274 [Phialocephala subalpina]|uniref:Nephrocystin 3-like N-terminal domain-containing protein n=1 Tax=Phialocephala subalpina TaxID=576137 RepID=A0A1L7XWF9_9HELO|nr:uncharacterized protein PAC_19274 [Phialocephala subalpina]